MKKVLFSLAALMIAGSMFAQTPEEKAAAKAAAKAEKEAIKQATARLNEGLAFYDAAKAKFDEMNTLPVLEKDPVKLEAKTLMCQKEIVENCTKGEPIVGEALATGKIPEKKLFDAWYKRDFMISQLINAELQKAQQSIAFDTAKFCQLTIGISDACHYQLKYGNPKDETQKNIMELVKTKFPKIHMYHAYATQFQIQSKNLAAACEAFDHYVNFAKNYPEVADNDQVKNPQTPYSMFAFNIYFTAYEQKRTDLMEKYHDQALEYEDPEMNTRDFVRQSSLQAILQRGDTAAWIKGCMELIKENPSSELGETYTQNLLAHYAKKGNAEMEQFADQILAIAPDSKMANYGKGFVLFAAQKFAEALEYYKKTIEADPDYMEGNYQAGMCLYQIGKENYNTIRDKKYKSQAEADKDAEAKVKKYFRDAIQYFEKVQEIVPDDPARWEPELRAIYDNLGMKNKSAALPTDY